MVAFVDSAKELLANNNLLNNIPYRPIGLALLLVFIVCLAIYLNTWFQTSLPNQWLLVIRDGKLKKAGVGLKEFVLPFETIVKFPSRVQRVQFHAENVTVQMQGISIEGFAFWSVDREGEGPFKCYKYMEGGKTNDHVKTLAESIVRNQLANFKLSDVIANRDLLKQKIKSQLAPQLRGWGIWLQTVELTDVRICSKKLFQDLQAEFRSETNLKAETVRLEGKTKSQTETIASKLKMLKIEQERTTQKRKLELKQQLKRKDQETKFYQQVSNMDIKKLEQAKLLELEAQNKLQEVRRFQLKNQQQREQERFKVLLEQERQDIQMSKMYNPVTLRKQKIDALEKAHTTMNMQETKIGQFVSSNKNDLYSLLPGFSEVMEQATTKAQ